MDVPPTMAKTTIYDWFSQGLPEFPQLGIQLATSHKSSGATTEACSSPLCGVHIPVEHWTNLATRLCLDLHQNKLAGISAPPINRSIAFKSEGDVVEASASYLRDPVQTAYQMVYPDDICLKQLTIPQKGQTNASRVDVAFFKGQPSDKERPGNSSNVFAVLEYKNFKGLVRDEFEEGMVSNFDGYAEAVDESPFVDSGTKTEVVLKQATHYAWRYNTPFVALCDYHTLILLVMDQAKDKDGGQYAYMTVIEKSADMRKAYLGFLLAARSYEKNKDDLGWRKNGAGEDIFVDAEDWEQEFQSGDAKRNAERNKRNSDPNHIAPGSQESEVSNKEVQSG